MSTMIDVICIGQAVIDCITKEKEAQPYKPNVYRASTIGLFTGGDAVNESIALSNLGNLVSILCALGNDMAGDIIFNEVSKHGVLTDLIQRTPSITTPIANLQVNQDGSRISINSNATRLEGISFDSISLPPAKVVSFASLFRPPLVHPKTIEHLMKRAKQNGSIICADTKLPLSDNLSIEDYNDILPLIDYFFPNENEAKYYSSLNDYSEITKFFHNKGIHNVIIKLGDKGCYVSNQKEEYLVEAIKIENIIDTTGAGDHFVAGFINGIIQEHTFSECVNMAMQEAAKSISHTGGNK
ncbi:MAG: carbohydrate kinase family protein [Solobacterium sp.]|nr:carbohydrate kinase family protein [Solobacterium sp.]